MQGCLTLADIDPQKTIYSVFFDLKNYIQTYLIDIIENVHFMQNYQQSLLAAAVIAASRKKLGLKPWTPTLENLSGYFIEDLEDPIEALQMYVHITRSYQKFLFYLCFQKSLF